MIIAQANDVRILIIDDDKLIRWVLQEICAQDGHDVTDVADTESACRAIKTGLYDMIFADLETEAFDAQEIAGKIKIHQPGASIVLFSSRPRREVESLFRGISSIGIVGKPFEASVVRSLIDELH